ncbi:MAG: hypothetical protein PHH85_03460 [Candidatus Methanoperedens sp.]|nr:hypothetical protein [Candidatus Methanoperedens sp.]
MGYFPDSINHQCHRPPEVKLGNRQKGEDCHTFIGVVHVWKLGVGCRGCPFFLDLHDYEKEDEDE